MQFQSFYIQNIIKEISTMIIFTNKIFILEILIIFFESNIFSEIFIANSRLKHHIIVSLSTSKEKIQALLVDRTIKSLLSQTVIIEIILINEDLKYFNKYYYIPDEYKKYVIITVDDDVILEKNSIEKLFKSYTSKSYFCEKSM